MSAVLHHLNQLPEQGASPIPKKKKPSSDSPISGHVTELTYQLGDGWAPRAVDVSHTHTLSRTDDVSVDRDQFKRFIVTFSPSLSFSHFYHI